MKNQYQITPMTQDEVEVAVGWAAQEGWNPGLEDGACFYRAAPQGFFAGKLNNKIIAVSSAVIYDEFFAFWGFYIVDKEYRDKGYGIELTNALLAYMGSRNVGMDGVIEMCDKYQSLGYKFAHNNARFRIERLGFNLKPNMNIIPAQQINFVHLVAYDKKHFPAYRSAFLRAWIEQKNALAVGFISEDGIQGYGVIRACREGYKIGPLFADTPEIADTLFQYLATFAKGQAIF